MRIDRLMSSGTCGPGFDSNPPMRFRQAHSLRDEQRDQVSQELQEKVRCAWHTGRSGVSAHGHILFDRLFPSKPWQDEVFGSAYATAVYISSVIKLPKDKKVFVVGMSGLEEELHEEGVAYIGGTVSPSNSLSCVCMDRPWTNALRTLHSTL